jgi:hypothetical protein
MHPQLTLILAQQHIADLHRAADHNRLVHTGTTATSSHAVLAPRHAAATAPISFLRWLRRAHKRVAAGSAAALPPEAEAVAQTSAPCDLFRPGHTARIPLSARVLEKLEK